MRHRLMPALFLPIMLLVSAAAQAQYEKPRNRLQLPLSTPVTVRVALPQTQLEASDAPGVSSAGAGPVGGAIAATIADARMDRHLGPQLERLRAEMPPRDYTAVLAEALHAELAATEGFPVAEVRTDAAADAAVEGPLLDIDAAYYMTPYFRDFRVVLRARVTRPGRKEPDFSQQLFYDMPAEGIGYFSGPSDMAAAWSRLDGARAAAHVEAGLRGLARMLAYELRRSPKFGRIPGKQREWREGEFTTYGVVETGDGRRAWLRLRNGHLASVPAPGEDAN
jgi:hypothetical protein